MNCTSNNNVITQTLHNKLCITKISVTVLYCSTQSVIKISSINALRCVLFALSFCIQFSLIADTVLHEPYRNICITLYRMCGVLTCGLLWMSG